MQESLNERHRAAIKAAAGGGECEETISGPLWLAAAPGKLARTNSAFLGMEGFLAGPLDGLLERLERDPELSPAENGHYVLAYADLDRKRLSLLRDLSGNEQLYFTLAM